MKGRLCDLRWEVYGGHGERHCLILNIAVFIYCIDLTDKSSLYD